MILFYSVIPPKFIAVHTQCMWKKPGITVTVVPLYVATLTRGHPSYEAMISGNKLCIIVLYPSREATLLIRPDFSFLKGGLKRGGPMQG